MPGALSPQRVEGLARLLGQAGPPEGSVVDLTLPLFFSSPVKGAGQGLATVLLGDDSFTPSSKTGFCFARSRICKHTRSYLGQALQWAAAFPGRDSAFGGPCPSPVLLSVWERLAGIGGDAWARSGAALSLGRPFVAAGPDPREEGMALSLCSSPRGFLFSGTGATPLSYVQKAPSRRGGGMRQTWLQALALRPPGPDA